MRKLDILKGKNILAGMQILYKISIIIIGFTPVYN